MKENINLVNEAICFIANKLNSNNINFYIVGAIGAYIDANIPLQRIHDDLDLMIRTFLHGKMCKIPKVLYIQHEGENRGGREHGDTTQSKRFDEIRRLGCILREKYDEDIHKRLLELGVEDPYWIQVNEKYGFSDIWSGVKENTTNLNYTLEL